MKVTECEIFLSLLVKFLDIDKPFWQRSLALEVLHILCIQPKLLRYSSLAMYNILCLSYSLKLQNFLNLLQVILSVL